MFPLASSSEYNCCCSGRNIRAMKKDLWGMPPIWLLIPANESRRYEGQVQAEKLPDVFVAFVEESSVAWQQSRKVLRIPKIQNQSIVQEEPWAPTLGSWSFMSPQQQLYVLVLQVSGNPSKISTQYREGSPLIKTAAHFPQSSRFHWADNGLPGPWAVSQDPDLCWNLDYYSFWGWN